MISTEAKARVLAGLIEVRAARDVARRRVFDYYTDPYDGGLPPVTNMDWDEDNWDDDKQWA